MLTEQDCRYRVIENSSFVSLLFIEVFSHHYISFFHLLVNGFCVTKVCSRSLCTQENYSNARTTGTIWTIFERE